MFPFSRSSNHLRCSWDPLKNIPILVFSNAPESMLGWKIPSPAWATTYPKLQDGEHDPIRIKGLQDFQTEDFPCKTKPGATTVCPSLTTSSERLLHSTSHAPAKKTSTSGIKTFIPGNPKQPFINGWFNWMIPNHYMKNGCFTKHPFIKGCLGFQVIIHPITELATLRAIMLWRDPSTPIENQLTRKAWGNPQKKN